MITLQTNSHPAAEVDKLNEVLGTIYQIVNGSAK